MPFKRSSYSERQAIFSGAPESAIPALNLESVEVAGVDLFSNQTHDVRASAIALRSGRSPEQIVPPEQAELLEALRYIFSGIFNGVQHPEARPTYRQTIEK